MIVVTGENACESATGICTEEAGNTASDSVPDITIENTAKPVE